MKQIAISNLAWQAQDDEKVFELMNRLQIHNLEISPFRESADLSVINKNSAHNLVTKLQRYGIHVIALQALLFRYPELLIFKDKAIREKTFNHLVDVISFANHVEAKALVFGSPKNKLRGEMNYDEAFAIAVEFFGKLAEVAKKYGTTFCLEPTPTIYNADFLVDTKETLDLVTHVGNSALKLNVDIGSMLVNNEDIEATILTEVAKIGHLHISEPHLKIINLDESLHQKIANAINESSYQGAISIEMLPQPHNTIERITETLTFVNKIYNPTATQ